jgi:CO/xanthine dehydrogenase Mo-binding subunit
LLSHHSILDCGTQVVPQLVSGQLQGGLSMGIGHALHEYLPLYEDGPGDGTWNWHRYRLPRASDVAVWKQTADILAPRSERDPPKGMAEVVTIAIIPAIANAVAHAIGRRFYEMPITPDKIRGALQ